MLKSWRLRRPPRDPTQIKRARALAQAARLTLTHGRTLAMAPRLPSSRSERALILVHLLSARDSKRALASLARDPRGQSPVETATS